MRIRSWFGLVLALGVSSATASNAAEWQTQSFELRLDRLYFPAGDESLIFEAAPFVILRTGDTIYSGLIEHSWEGVSVSAPTRGIFDTIPPAGLKAILTTAEVDTSSRIAFGNELSRLSIRTVSSGIPRLDWLDYTTPLDPLREDFLSGTLDAIVSLTDFSPHPAEVTTVSAPLHYIVVLIPNISREFNYHGELTTSLYYRCSARQLAVCFRGDEVTEVRRFTNSGFDLFPPPRRYDLDPARGKKLFDLIAHRPSSVRLHAGHPKLDGAARYFADLLSQDRCRVELTVDPNAADVRLEFVPSQDSSPRTVVDNLVEVLARDSVKGSPPAEYLRRIGLELRGLDIALQAADSIRHLEAIDRILSEDLGIFPLFRPSLFVHTHRWLRGVTITRDGLVDLSTAVKIRLPQDSSGGTR